ncbi:bifunctional folylpolyglutamate synthase/dihydrofolate synthase, partial [Candidatus Woesearchaeota archaeon]|nr:bifunctional folylpolyglutamate synthase/dihydrofolate synthase [Candidatus Woesearchaeota archaeon]
IEKIAYEKSGIIKEAIPVVTAAEGIALDTIKKISNKKNSKLITINKDGIKIKYNNPIKKIINTNNKIIGLNYLTFDFNGYKNIKLKKLNGRFQALNAAIAIKSIDTIKNSYNLKINGDNVKKGLLNAKWRGRLEFIAKNVLVDCAHNPSGFRILASELKTLNYKNLIIILGFSNDKDIKAISEIINPMANKIILTKSSNERAAEPEAIKKYFKNSMIIKNPKEALKHAKKIAKKEDLVLIAGSIFFVGELM